MEVSEETQVVVEQTENEIEQEKSMNNKQDSFEIPKVTVNEVIGYLHTRPYKEVALLIHHLQQICMEQTKQDGI